MHPPLPSLISHLRGVNGPNRPRVRTGDATVILTTLSPTPDQCKEENNTKENKPYSIQILLDLGGHGKCILAAGHSLTQPVELRQLETLEG